MSKAQGLTVLCICQEDVLYDRYDWQAALSLHLHPQLHPTRILLDNNSGIYQRIGYAINTT
jgi:hypothetical protein